MLITWYVDIVFAVGNNVIKYGSDIASSDKKRKE